LTKSRIQTAIEATKDEDYLRALTLFIEVYEEEDAPSVSSTLAASGLSYFGLCLALVQKKYKLAVELCKRAIDLQFYNGEHYANLARVYLAAGNRRKALETAESGLIAHPDHDEILAARNELGVRAKPAVPLLDRTHPINVTLGRKRHAKKVAKSDKKP
jgi:tetratricopeptide (TPR) repeat protein